MSRRGRRKARVPVHAPPLALCADASFDSILRYPGFGVTACAAAAGVHVCAGACAHVRGSAVLGGVDTEPGWLQQKYANAHYQISSRVATMTGMPLDFVCNYWGQHTHLTAEGLIHDIRDEKYRLLTNTPRKEQGPISEHYASFLQNTDIAIQSLFDYTDEKLEELELDWLSQQTGFTRKEITDILEEYEQGDDADMSKLGKLRKKKASALEAYGVEREKALELAQKRENMQTVLNDYFHARGYACAYACTRPPDAPVARTCYYAFAPACPALCASPWGWHQCPAAAATKTPSAMTHTVGSHTRPGDAATEGSVELGDIFTFRPHTLIPSLSDTPEEFEVTVTAIEKLDYHDEFDANKLKTRLDYALRSIQPAYTLTVDSEDIQKMMASSHNLYGLLSKCKRKDEEMLSKRVQSVEVGDLFVLCGVQDTVAYEKDPEGIYLQVTKIEYEYPEDYERDLSFFGNTFK
jgi:hypothetical protein